MEVGLVLQVLARVGIDLDALVVLVLASLATCTANLAVGVGGAVSAVRIDVHLEGVGVEVILAVVASDNGQRNTTDGVTGAKVTVLRGGLLAYVGRLRRALGRGCGSAGLGAGRGLGAGSRLGSRARGLSGGGLGGGLGGGARVGAGTGRVGGRNTSAGSGDRLGGGSANMAGLKGLPAVKLVALGAVVATATVALEALAPSGVLEAVQAVRITGLVETRPNGNLALLPGGVAVLFASPLGSGRQAPLANLVLASGGSDDSGSARARSSGGRLRGGTRVGSGTRVGRGAGRRTSRGTG